MKQLYMFAIMPPPSLAEKINNERRIFAAKYRCVKALKPPVHVTIYPPFKELAAFEEPVRNIGQWVSDQLRFTLELHDYNFFKNRVSPVVYIDVVKNSALSKLRAGFVAQLQNYMPVEAEGTYTPHFTIGYRDVPAKLFPAIEAEYSKRTFNGSFEVESIYLWKHDGKNWQILQEYKLGVDNKLF